MSATYVPISEDQRVRSVIDFAVISLDSELSVRHDCIFGDVSISAICAGTTHAQIAQLEILSIGT